MESSRINDESLSVTRKKNQAFGWHTICLFSVTASTECREGQGWPEKAGRIANQLKVHFQEYVLVTLVELKCEECPINRIMMLHGDID